VSEFDYHFEWNTEKAAINATKHGVTFRTATEAVRDPLIRTIFDADQGDKERTNKLRGIDMSEEMKEEYDFSNAERGRFTVRMLTSTFRCTWRKAFSAG
jgi:hypothetical protein